MSEVNLCDQISNLSLSDKGIFKPSREDVRRYMPSFTKVYFLIPSLICLLICQLCFIVCRYLDDFVSRLIIACICVSSRQRSREVFLTETDFVAATQLNWAYTL